MGSLIWCSTPPGFGHFGPTAPVARALGEAGHDVRVVTSPLFVPTVERAGLRGMGLGRPWLEERVEEAFSECCENGIPFMSLVFEAAAAEMLDAMLAQARGERPDLIVWVWPVDYAGAVAAAALGVPSIALATSAITSLDTYMLMAGGALTRLRQRARLDDDASHRWLTAIPHVTFFPASLHVTDDQQVSVDRCRYEALDTTEGTMPPQVAALLEGDDPLVLATLGTVYNRRGLLPLLIEALAGQPYRVVLATGSTVAPQDLPQMPANVTTVPWVPFSQLIGHCDLVVHHGGTNTTLLAAREGVPTVTVPIGADQFTNAGLAAGAGVSQMVPSANRTPAGLRQAVTDVLADGSHRQRAATLAAEMSSMPPIGSVLPPLVERLLQRDL